MGVAALLKWKRERAAEEAHSDEPQAKRDRGSPEPPAAENASGTSLKKKMAVAYLAKLKATCDANDDTVTYLKFLQLTKDFLAQRDINDVLKRATELFQGTYDNLLEEFIQEFLLEGERITLREYERQQSLIFKRKVQDLGPLKYAAFCDTLKMWKNHRISINRLYKSMRELFVGRSDLLEEYYRLFLHESSTIVSKMAAGECGKQELVRTPKTTRWWWNLLSETKVSAIESENAVPAGENSQHGDVKKQSKGKGKMKMKESNDYMRRRMEKNNNEDGFRIKAEDDDTQGCENKLTRVAKRILPIRGKNRGKAPAGSQQPAPIMSTKPPEPFERHCKCGGRCKICYPMEWHFC